MREVEARVTLLTPSSPPEFHSHLELNVDQYKPGTSSLPAAGQGTPAAPASHILTCVLLLSEGTQRQEGWEGWRRAAIPEPQSEF